ncbi:MAG: hypothetical protein ABI947_03465 [Chloroflexota bacterium]
MSHQRWSTSWETLEEFTNQAKAMVEAANFQYEYNPEYTRTNLDFWIDKLERRKNAEAHHARDTRIKTLNAVLIQAYNHRMACYLTLCDLTNVVETIRHDFRRVCVLAEETGDVIGRAQAWAWLAGAHYVSMQPKDSIACVEKALSLVPPTPALPYLFQVYAALILNYAYMGKDYTALEDKVRAMLDEHTVERSASRASLIEALARANILSNRLSDAQQRLIEAQEECLHGPTPLTQLQIHRGQLVALAQVTHVDKDHALIVANHALMLAGKQRKRYVIQIRQCAQSLGILDVIRENVQALLN